MPYIPGSAVKGCARRAATQTLLDAEKPLEKAAILAKLCLIFGWADTDWKPGRRREWRQERMQETTPYSDFWWAMAPETGDREADDAQRSQAWAEVAVIAATRLLEKLRITSRHPDKPWQDLPNFAGSIGFLHGYPVDMDGVDTQKLNDLHTLPNPTGELELDVVTCHHRKYYGGDKNMPHALDTEDPIPNFFPSVAAGHIFSFPLCPLHNRTNPELLDQAKTWLVLGLATFGLGAKSNAGYGWLKDVSASMETLQAEVKRLEAQREAEVRKNAQREADRLAKIKAEEAEIARRQAEKEKAQRLAAQMANLSPEEKADALFAQKAEANWGWMKDHLSKFPSHKPEEQKLILRWFCGAGQERWTKEIKPGAASGKKPWNQIIGAINTAKKTHNIELP